MLKELQCQQAKSYDCTQQTQPNLVSQFTVGTYVLWKDLSCKKPGAKGKFVRQYLGPYKIIKVCSENMIVIQLPGGLKQVHINNIS